MRKEKDTGGRQISFRWGCSKKKHGGGVARSAGYLQCSQAAHALAESLRHGDNLASSKVAAPRQDEKQAFVKSEKRQLRNISACMLCSRQVAKSPQPISGRALFNRDAQVGQPVGLVAGGNVSAFYGGPPVSHRKATSVDPQTTLLPAWQLANIGTRGQRVAHRVEPLDTRLLSHARLAFITVG